MKKYISIFLSPIFILVIISSSFAQLNINTGMTPAQLVQNILVQGNYTVSNITYQGTTGSTTSQFGAFTNGNTTNLGLTSGIVLSSGYVNHIPAAASTSGAMSDYTDSGSDVDLASLVGGTAGTNDACVLQFDFVPTSNIVSFRYVFGAEEYPDFVCSIFNDAIGFFLSGPGISGPYSNGAVNIALIPSTTTPVSINTVNGGVSADSTTPCILTNSAYYVNNSSGTSLVWGGFTKVLTASHNVIPYQKYHIKIAIADVGDEAYDSGLFLDACNLPTNVFTVTPTYSNPSLSNNAIEGCTNGIFTFKTPTPVTSPLTITYTIGGTATNGVDYTAISNSITIPAGQDTGAVIIHPIDDGITEGTETVTLSIINGCAIQTDTIRIIDNNLSALDIIPMDSINICSGNNAAIIAHQGFDTYKWSNGDTTNSITINSGGMFYVTVTSQCGTFTDSIYSKILPVTHVNLGKDTITCSSTGVILDAGTVFSSYHWSTGESTQTITAITSGEYIVTATNVNGCFSQDTINVLINPILGFDLGKDTSFCQYDSIIIKSPNLYDTYHWSTGDSTSQITVSKAGMYYVTVTSITCGGTAIDSIYVTMNLAPVANAGTNDTICNGTLANLSASGGSNYYWSNGASTQGITPIPLSTTPYTVTVTNSSGCSATDDVLVFVYPEITSTITIMPATCGLSNGTATAVPAGGSGTYSFTWSTIPSQTTATASGLAAGIYQITITDNKNGCKEIVPVAVTAIPQITLTVSSTYEYCYKSNGTATVVPSGGSGTYSYVWNNGQTTQLITGLAAGIYTVSVSDGSCTASASIIVSSVSGPLVQFTNIVNASCGYSNGSATATASGGITPYSYLWSNSQTTQTATGLAKGTYYINVTDSTGCITHDSVYINCVSAVMEYENISNIVVAPNPSNGVFTITLQNTPNKNSEIEIFNSLGQSINKDILNTQTKTIDISNYPKGFYFLKISSEEKYLFKKIIKE